MRALTGRWGQLSTMQRREARTGLLFVLPWLIGLVVFTAYPIIASIYLSFTSYTIVQSPKWIGLDNYKTMFTADPSFLLSVSNSLIYALLAVPLSLIVSLGLALLLNMKTAGIGVYRTLFYLPSLVPPVAGTIIFVVLLNPQGGLVNVVLQALGMTPPGWFTDPAWAKPALVMLSLWRVGEGALIFLAGLQDIPASLLEAAAIDGASAFQRFRRITLPLLTPVILFNLVMSVIYSFQVFTQALVVGGTTGQPLESTLMFMVLIYRNAFRYFKLGYASALAVLLFIVIMTLTLVIFRSAKLWVFYEGDNN